MEYIKYHTCTLIALDTIYTEYGVAMTVVSGLNYNFTTRLVITVSCTARYAKSALILT